NSTSVNAGRSSRWPEGAVPHGTGFGIMAIPPVRKRAKTGEIRSPQHEPFCTPSFLSRIRGDMIVEHCYYRKVSPDTASAKVSRPRQTGEASEMRHRL